MWYVPLVLTALLRAALGEIPWWSNGIYYRILVDSFKDGDGDGLGDLSAKSGDCSKPGVTNLAGIDQRYGNQEALGLFLDKTKKLELKTVITLPIETISTESEWFNCSANKLTGFEDRVIWQDAQEGNIPSTQNGIDKWTWHEGRAAYFAAKENEAVLNLCSEGAQAAVAAAQCAWLRRGFNGVLFNPDFGSNQWCGQKFLQKMVTEAMVCARSSNLDTPVILVETALEPQNASQYYSDGGIGANSILSTTLTSPTKRTSSEMALSIHATLLYAPTDSTPTWITSAPYESRIATRYGSDMVDAINLLALILPGAVVIQQGDELGVADTILEWSTTQTTCWPGYKVPSSAPFPWSDALNGGFTNGDPWLPLAPNYRYANAKTEFANDNSHLGVLKVAAAMRKSPAIGPHVEIKRLGSAIAVLRWGGPGSLLVVANLGNDPTEARLSAIYGLPSEMTVAASSAGSSLATGSHAVLEKPLKLGPGEALLLAGGPRHCGGPGPVDKIANKLTEGWQKLNKYFGNI